MSLGLCSTVQLCNLSCPKAESRTEGLAVVVSLSFQFGHDHRHLIASNMFLRKHHDLSSHGTYMALIEGSTDRGIQGKSLALTNHVYTCLPERCARKTWQWASGLGNAIWPS
jgi:hypothetical protein